MANYASAPPPTLSKPGENIELPNAPGKVQFPDDPKSKDPNSKDPKPGDSKRPATDPGATTTADSSTKSQLL